MIAGRVLWQESNIGIADAKVCILNSAGTVVAMANTNLPGLFRIEVPAGAYIVSAEKQNLVREYYPDEYSFKEADPITVFGGEVRNVGFKLALGGWISGNFSFYGADTESGLITAIKIDQPHAGWYKSQSLSGPYPSAYAVTGLIPGTYKIVGRARGKSTEFFPGVLRIEDATPIQVLEGVGVNNISFVLDEVGWGSIHGRVYDSVSGEGIAGIRALAYQWQNYWEDPALDSAVTCVDGSFLFNLSAGRYYVMVQYRDLFSAAPVAVYYFNHYDQRQAQAVNVAEGHQVDGINFPIDYSIPHNLTISGAISSEISGLGLDDVVVTAIDYDSGEIMGSSSSYNDGEFAIGGLSPRRYLLMFSGTQIVPYFFSRAHSWQDADIITLDRDFGGVRTDAITQDYGDNGLAILGRVTTRGLPIEGARVYAFPLGYPDPVAYAFTDAYGEYSIIGGLAPGEYTVVCDHYGYEKEIYPVPVAIDLISDPIADDINFEILPVLTSVAGDVLPPVRIELAGNYPNPFNSRTIINFYSSRGAVGDGWLTVYNLLGQAVGRKPMSIAPGINRVAWDMSDFGSPVSSGVYYYRVDGSDGIGRMILLK